MTRLHSNNNTRNDFITNDYVYGLNVSKKNYNGYNGEKYIVTM